MSSPLIEHWTLDPDVVHLNHGSFGAAPRVVLAEQQRWRDLLESNPDAFVHEHYQPALDAARLCLADFLGTHVSGVGFVNNATSGVNAILRSLEAVLAPGDELLVTDHTYNACRNAAEVSALRTGAEVVTAPLPFPVASRCEVREAVLAHVTDRTRLVLVDAVTSSTALVLPIAELVEELEPDVQVLVDAAHAPGMIDFDVDALAASYVVGNCHKWLCAPKGAAFVAVREDRRELVYSAVVSHGYNGGWPSPGGHLHQQFDWTGTDDPSAWLSVPVALETVAALHHDGWPGVRRTNHELCLAGRDLVLDGLGRDAPAPDDMIGSIAAIPLASSADGGAPIVDPLMMRLRHRWGIEAAVFAWGQLRLLRLSAQLYNAIDDYERLVDALLELGPEEGIDGLDRR